MDAEASAKANSRLVIVDRLLAQRSPFGASAPNYPNGFIALLRAS